MLNTHFVSDAAALDPADRFGLLARSLNDAAWEENARDLAHEAAQQALREFDVCGSAYSRYLAERGGYEGVDCDQGPEGDPDGGSVQEMWAHYEISGKEDQGRRVVDAICDQAADGETLNSTDLAFIVEPVHAGIPVDDACRGRIREIIHARLDPRGIGVPALRKLGSVQTTYDAYWLAGRQLDTPNTLPVTLKKRLVSEAEDPLARAEAAWILNTLGELSDEDRAAVVPEKLVADLDDVKAAQVTYVLRASGISAPDVTVDVHPVMSEEDRAMALRLLALLTVVRNRDDVEVAWSSEVDKALAGADQYTGPSRLLIDALNASHLVGTAEEDAAHDVAELLKDDTTCGDVALGPDLVVDGAPSGQSCSVDTKVQLRMAGALEW